MNTQCSFSLASLLAIAPTTFAQTSIDLSRAANDALGLRSSEVVMMTAPAAEGSSILTSFELAGQPVYLQLQPDSVRAPGFQVIEIGADGQPVSLDPGPVRTLSGDLYGIPGSSVRGAHLDDGYYLRLLVPGFDELWMQPLATQVPNVHSGYHVLYRTSDIVDPQRPCGSDRLADVRTDMQQTSSGGGSFYGGTSTAELACDADYEYYLDYGSSSAVQNRIETVIGTMNTQYENQVGITHQITAIVVRSSSNQPYTSTDANTLLNQFRNEWNNNQGSVQRDVAQLFTGKEVNGGTIGIAWLGVICHSSYGYGLVQSDFNGNFGCATDLSAHELGHNWNAGHCSCTSNTMNPYITCANNFSSNFTIPDIIAHRDSRSCLDGSGGPTTPTDVSVASITTSTVNLGQGRKSARAVIVIRDDLGNAVSGKTVSCTVTGDLNESLSGVTGSDGSVTLTTVGWKKGRLRFTFCVDDVTGTGLPYDANDNAVTCAQN
ncbi:MAG: hypothetical protein ACI841_001495 [Planctomycetota bacterium]|jgi:hypothetical protein